MDSVDNLVYSKKLRKPKGEVSLFTKSAEYIKITPPPINSSLGSARDMITVNSAIKLCGEGMKKSIKKHDKDPAFAIKMYMSLFGLDHDVDYINKVMSDATILIREQKNLFNRPRPSQLAPYFGMDLEVLNSRTSTSPSYPGGHSTQSRLIAEIYADKYPEHRQNLIKAADECGGGRIMAGLHYPSDHRAGVYFAKRLFRSMKNQVIKKYDQTFDLTTNKGEK